MCMSAFCSMYYLISVILFLLFGRSIKSFLGDLFCFILFFSGEHIQRYTWTHVLLLQLGFNTGCLRVRTQNNKYRTQDRQKLEYVWATCTTLWTMKGTSLCLQIININKKKEDDVEKLQWNANIISKRSFLKQHSKSKTLLSKTKVNLGQLTGTYKCCWE